MEKVETVLVCEQAIKGETVLVEGKLEKVEFKGKEEHFRLILRDQNKDRMVIQSDF